MSHSVLKELQGRRRGDAPTPPPPSRALEPPPHTYDKTLESLFSSSPSHQPPDTAASLLRSASNQQDISAEAASTKVMPAANQEPSSSSFSSNGEVAECSKLFGEDDTGKERKRESKNTEFRNFNSSRSFLYFLRATASWPLLCLCRSFHVVFLRDSILDWNPESCRCKQARYQLSQCNYSHPSP
jgi:hypothetical protein